VNIDEAKIGRDFFFHILGLLTKKIEDKAHGASALVHVQKGEMEVYEITIPVSLAEQQAIAAALSDVDSLIAALDALIVKKRNIKQGAMQELLTGKKRLAGFSGEWEEKNLFEHSTLKARIGWQGLTTAEYLDTGDYYLVTGTDFYDGKIKWETCHFVDEWRYAQDKNIQLKEGDVVITKDGTIGKVAYINQLPGKATLNSGVFVIRPKENAYLSEYLYYVLKSEHFDTFLRQLQAGSTISHLYQKDFINFTFSAPLMEEQQAIVKVLSDMDAEIEGLERKRAKYQSVKQGMMQELLTGKTRLV
jgi:type I restriction enzyme S subunit